MRVLQRLEFLGFNADLICEARASPGEPCRIAVKNGGPFLLKVAAGGHAVERQMRPGTQTFEIAAE